LRPAARRKSRRARARGRLAPSCERHHGIACTHQEILLRFAVDARERRAERLPGEFKSGLYRLSTKFPEVELVPVYLDNLYRAMPKGRALPVPLSCAVRFGAPLPRVDGESKEDFLMRARDAVVGLA